MYMYMCMLVLHVYTSTNHTTNTVSIFLPKQAEEELKQFLSEEHTFPEYEKMVLKYEELIQELQYETEKVIHLHAYMYVCT